MLHCQFPWCSPIYTQWLIKVGCWSYYDWVIVPLPLVRLIVPSHWLQLASMNSLLVEDKVNNCEGVCLRYFEITVWFVTSSVVKLAFSYERSQKWKIKWCREVIWGDFMINPLDFNYLACAVRGIRLMTLIHVYSQTWSCGTSELNLLQVTTRYKVPAAQFYSDASKGNEDISDRKATLITEQHEPAGNNVLCYRTCFLKVSRLIWKCVFWVLGGKHILKIKRSPCTYWELVKPPGFSFIPNVLITMAGSGTSRLVNGR